jgi:steroid delta-isomerase-like uncharacterized protein
MSTSLTVQRAMFQAVVERDLDALRETLHPTDYIYTDCSGAEQKGADAGVAVAASYFAAFPDMTFEWRHEYAIDETTAVTELTVRGTHTGPLEDIPATGKTIELVVCNVVEVRDGKIVREREYYDMLSLLTQLDVLPAS